MKIANVDVRWTTGQEQWRERDKTGRRLLNALAALWRIADAWLHRPECAAWKRCELHLSTIAQQGHQCCYGVWSTRPLALEHEHSFLEATRIHFVRETLRLTMGYPECPQPGDEL